MKITNALDAGSIWVNCYEVVLNNAPFGGYKRNKFFIISFKKKKI